MKSKKSNVHIRTQNQTEKHMQPQNIESKLSLFARDIYCFTDDLIEYTSKKLSNDELIYKKHKKLYYSIIITTVIGILTLVIPIVLYILNFMSVFLLDLYIYTSIIILFFSIVFIILLERKVKNKKNGLQFLRSKMIYNHLKKNRISKEEIQIIFNILEDKIESQNRNNIKMLTIFALLIFSIWDSLMSKIFENTISAEKLVTILFLSVLIMVITKVVMLFSNFSSKYINYKYEYICSLRNIIKNLLIIYE